MFQGLSFSLFSLVQMTALNVIIHLSICQNLKLVPVPCTISEWLITSRLRSREQQCISNQTTCWGHGSQHSLKDTWITKRGVTKKTGDFSWSCGTPHKHTPENYLRLFFFGCVETTVFVHANIKGRLELFWVTFLEKISFSRVPLDFKGFFKIARKALTKRVPGYKI